MPYTKTFEPVRPLEASDDGSPFCKRAVLGPALLVHYGEVHWPSRSYWLVPQEGTSPVYSL